MGLFFVEVLIFTPVSTLILIFKVKCRKLEQFGDSISKGFNDSETSDVVILVGKERINAHRVIFYIFLISYFYSFWLNFRVYCV